MVGGREGREVELLYLDAIKESSAGNEFNSAWNARKLIKRKNKKLADSFLAQNRQKEFVKFESNHFFVFKH